MFPPAVNILENYPKYSSRQRNSETGSLKPIIETLRKSRTSRMRLFGIAQSRMRKSDLRLLRNQVNGGVVGLTGKSCKPRKNPITLRNAEKPHAADAAFAQAL
ncbi:hypothetical protein DFH08DRAFT_798886 [Mycena albidolilacea]|uniref:Uncharacterized protein n=1 Tax=Mycena albidolilacea TaxID=1033008 RepID=A0AAD7F470_9AGAR|nr:hypothetical protein DFH08DRAFT_798886 [Mycena albidolilacea]